MHTLQWQQLVEPLDTVGDNNAYLGDEKVINDHTASLMI